MDEQLRGDRLHISFTCISNHHKLQITAHPFTADNSVLNKLCSRQSRPQHRIPPFEVAVTEQEEYTKCLLIDCTITNFIFLTLRYCGRIDLTSLD